MEFWPQDLVCWIQPHQQPSDLSLSNMIALAKNYSTHCFKCWFGFLLWLACFDSNYYSFRKSVMIETLQMSVCRKLGSVLDSLHHWLLCGCPEAMGTLVRGASPTGRKPQARINHELAGRKRKHNFVFLKKKKLNMSNFKTI